MKRSIMVGRHIEDMNDLHNNRDCGVNPEFIKETPPIARQIIESCIEDGSSIVLFVSSPKLRATETVQLVREHIRDQSQLRTLSVVEPGIREIDQGAFILPPDYFVGMYVPELMKAWEVFWEETFTNGDFHYRFGSPVNRAGVEVYPELRNFFSASGESYMEYTHRLYSSVLALLHNTRLLRRKGTKIIATTHSAPLAIFRELHSIADTIIEGTDYPVGSLMTACWEGYKVRTENQDPGFGYIENFDLEPLTDPRVSVRLEKEVEYLAKEMAKQL